MTRKRNRPQLPAGLKLYAGPEIAEAGFSQAALVEAAQAAFGDDVGGSGDFRDLVSVAYAPGVDSRAHHLLIAEGDTIMALVLSYPRHGRILGTETRFETRGIGTVSTLPEARGRGLMSALVTEAVRQAAAEGACLLNLSGQRQRYQNYGFDLVSPRMTYRVDERNLRGIEPLPQERYRYVPFNEIKALPELPDLYELYLTEQRITLRKDYEDFCRTLPMWETGIYIAYDRQGKPVAYMGAMGRPHDKTSTSAYIEELCFRDPELLLPLLKALFRDEREAYASLSVAPQGHQMALLHVLEQRAESVVLEARGKACVLDVPMAIKLALALEDPELLKRLPKRRAFRTENALGEVQRFELPTFVEGPELELSYEEFLGLFAVDHALALNLETKLALAPLLPLHLPDLKGDFV